MMGVHKSEFVYWTERDGKRIERKYLAHLEEALGIRYDGLREARKDSGNRNTWTYKGQVYHYARVPETPEEPEAVEIVEAKPWIDPVEYIEDRPPKRYAAYPLIRDTETYRAGVWR
jgi:hypothetical protein